MNSSTDFDRQRVTTTDDTLSIYRYRNLNSDVIAAFAKGVEIQLEAATIFEGREWINATLADGRVGYVLGPSVRGHTMPGGTPSVLPIHHARLLTVAEQRRQTIFQFGILHCNRSRLLRLAPGSRAHARNARHEPFLKVLVSFSVLLMLIHAVTSG